MLRIYAGFKVYKWGINNFNPQISSYDIIRKGSVKAPSFLLEPKSLIGVLNLIDINE